MNIKTLSLSFLSLSILGLTACSGASDQASAGDSPKTKTQIPENSKLAASRARDGALGDMSQGNDDASVTLVEYASLTCGHCATFHDAAYPSIKEKYVDTGKVKFVFRELPTPPQDRSFLASALARCTADKGGDEAYFVMTDALFESQREWAFGANPLGELQKIAAQAGLNNEDLKACWQRQEILDVINDNVKEADERFKISGTPSFVLNGEKLTLRNFGDLEVKLAEATGTVIEVDETEEAIGEAPAGSGESHDGDDADDHSHDEGQDHGDKDGDDHQ